jgi:hypothetical protein
LKLFVHICNSQKELVFFNFSFLGDIFQVLIQNISNIYKWRCLLKKFLGKGGEASPRRTNVRFKRD